MKRKVSYLFLMLAASMPQVYAMLYRAPQAQIRRQPAVRFDRQQAQRPVNQLPYRQNVAPATTPTSYASPIQRFSPAPRIMPERTNAVFPAAAATVFKQQGPITQKRGLFDSLKSWFGLPKVDYSFEGGGYNQPFVKDDGSLETEQEVEKRKKDAAFLGAALTDDLKWPDGYNLQKYNDKIMEVVSGFPVKSLFFAYNPRGQSLIVDLLQNYLLASVIKEYHVKIDALALNASTHHTDEEKLFADIENTAEKILKDKKLDPFYEKLVKVLTDRGIAIDDDHISALAREGGNSQLSLRPMRNIILFSNNPWLIKASMKATNGEKLFTGLDKSVIEKWAYASLYTFTIGTKNWIRLSNGMRVYPFLAEGIVDELNHIARSQYGSEEFFREKPKGYNYTYIKRNGTIYKKTVLSGIEFRLKVGDLGYGYDNSASDSDYSAFAKDEPAFDYSVKSDTLPESLQDYYKYAFTYEKYGKPFMILGLSDKATKKEMKKAYLTLISKYHPDKYISAEDKQLAEKISKILNAAKEKLGL